MTRQRVARDQAQLRDATERYLDALPAMHREVFQLIAADQDKAPYMVIAGALERVIGEWRAGLLVGVGTGR